MFFGDLEPNPGQLVVEPFWVSGLQCMSDAICWLAKNGNHAFRLRVLPAHEPLYLYAAATYVKDRWNKRNGRA